ncbi:hypothetical protein EMIT0P395_90259 [Pseudomonas sp. IT-P395]
MHFLAIHRQKFVPPLLSRSSIFSAHLSDLTGALTHQYRFNHSITRPECIAVFVNDPKPESTSTRTEFVRTGRHQKAPECSSRGLA